jgi:hypothetical protein
MRFKVLCGLLLVPACALAQASFQPDHRQWTAPGTYAGPVQPLVSTPVTSSERVPTPLISLDPVFLTAGASNATAGNQAGATNSTAGQDLSAAPIFATQAWYGPATPNSEVQAETENTDFFPSMSTPELGIAQFEFSHGAKQVMVKPRSHAQRAFTEADVARMNDANGLVRFKGKTEHVD